MKAWRSNKAQADFRREHKIPAHYRVGRAVRDNVVRILPAPSFLVQALLIRAGVLKAG